MHLTGIDHVEFYVADLEAAREQFGGRYGFSVVAATDPTDRRSLLLTQGEARLVLTAGVGGHSDVDAFIDAHGDGVKTIALRVPDARQAFALAVEGGATPLRSPVTGGGAVAAAVEGLQTMAHAFVERSAETALLPGFAPVGPGERRPSSPALIRGIDHLAICLPRGTLNAAEEFYGRTLGLQPTFTDYVRLGEQAMDSVVVADPGRRVTFTLVAPDCEDGQLVDFLSAYGGGGVQHVAFLTDAIAQALPEFAARGVEFLVIPPQYYDSLPGRLGYTAAQARALSDIGILADRDPWGDLLQIFTRSTFPRRTFFVELIERRCARSFGSANIKALYEAAENERRGMLLGARGVGR
ncbi:MAG: 4-hydroxyphenylpyruvate dioxygenase [Actinomycetota bacterium]|nr:4-hydroxyphenylpyruvate dioxygenase [Actinomycetota bacterium]